MMASQHVLRDRTKLDAIGEGVCLKASEHTDGGTLVAIASGVLEKMPADVTFERVQDDDPVYVYNNTILAFRAMRDDKGQEWVCAMCAGAVVLDEDFEQEIKHGDLLNALNRNGRGFLWALSEQKLLAISGAARKLSEVGESWSRMVANLVVAVSEAAARIQDERSPIVSYAETLRIIADDPAHSYSWSDVSESLHQYIAELPADISDIVSRGVHASEDAVFLNIPFYDSSGHKNVTIVIDIAEESEDSDGELGVKLISVLDHDFTLSDARKWCAVFNGIDDAEDDWHNTTPWLMGGWVYLEVSPEVFKVGYCGKVPNFQKPNTRLSDVISGVVREVWRAMDKIRLDVEFGEATAGVFP